MLSPIKGAQPTNQPTSARRAPAAGSAGRPLASYSPSCLPTPRNLVAAVAPCGLALAPQMRLNMPLIDLSDERLRLYRQVGAEEVTLPGGSRCADMLERLTDQPVRPLVPPAQIRGKPSKLEAWDMEELRLMVARCAEYGLQASVRNLGMSGAILGGPPEAAAEDLAVVQRNIAAAGAAGIRTLTWDFTALRSSEGYGAALGAGRGGADLRDFDSSRLGTAALAEGPPPCTHAEMWSRLLNALEAMVPAAEQAGVVLALHPTDPPVPWFRGVAQILVNFEECQRLVGLVDSPSNCFFLDTGTSPFDQHPRLLTRIVRRLIFPYT
jgi:hypothetical protein